MLVNLGAKFKFSIKTDSLALISKYPYSTWQWWCWNLREQSG